MRPAVDRARRGAGGMLGAALALMAVAVLGACGATDPTAAADPADPGIPAASSEASSPAPKAEAGGESDASTAPGRYVDWADYDAARARYHKGDVVLFFHAAWCPTCRAAEEAIEADGVPDGLTIVKVDFDTATDLREEYGVTVQHTFVQVDPDGAELKKWTGTISGADIAAELV